MSCRISRGWRASIGIPRFYLWPRRGHTSGFTSISGRSPRSTRSISPETCIAAWRVASRVTPAMCEEHTTFSRFRIGLSRDVGSSSQTSRPAAASLPRVSASKSARSSCTGPREVLMKMALGFVDREGALQGDEQQHQRVLGDGLGVGAGSVDDRNAEPGCGWYIHGVESDSMPSDDLELLTGPHQAFRAPRPYPEQDPQRLRGRLDQAGLGLVLAEDDPRLLLEEGFAVGMEPTLTHA